MRRLAAIAIVMAGATNAALHGQCKTVASIAEQVSAADPR